MKKLIHITVPWFNYVFIVLLCAVLLSFNVQVAICSSNYCINNSVTSAGGRNITSAGFTLQTAAGQTAVGEVTSANYYISQGFFHRAFLISVPLLGLPLSIISFIIEEDIIKFIINLRGANI